jgi:hypothetical protein
MLKRDLPRSVEPDDWVIVPCAALVPPSPNGCHEVRMSSIRVSRTGRMVRSLRSGADRQQFCEYLLRQRDRCGFDILAQMFD